MFWRLMEYLFLAVVAVFGARFVYLLWRGPDIDKAQAQLGDVQEDAEAEQLKRRADKIRHFLGVKAARDLSLDLTVPHRATAGNSSNQR